MTCEQFKQNIDSYLEGVLKENESLEFEKHLRSCPQCQKELMSFEKCIKLMQNFMKDTNPPDTIRKGVFKKLNCNDMMKMWCLPRKD